MSVSAPAPESLIRPNPFSVIESYTRGTLFADPSVFIDKDLPAKAKSPPFDSYHYWYYNDRGHEATVETARQQTIWEFGAMNIAQGDMPSLYRPFSITGGVRSHELAIAFDHRQDFDLAGKKARLRTTRDLDQSAIGRERMAQDVIALNHRDTQYLTQLLRKTFYDYALIDPLDKEGAVRINRLDSDTSFGRQPREEDFMSLWYALVDQTDGLIWTPNITFSRNGNWEEMRGIFNALGYLNGITRAQKGYKFYRTDRSYSTFAERLQYNLDYLIYAAENDFHASEAATCVAWKLEIAKRLSSKKYNENSYRPIQLKQLDPMLRMEFHTDAVWATACQEKIAELTGVLEAMLKDHFITHIRDEHMLGLPADYHEVRTKKAKPFVGWQKNPACVREALTRLEDKEIYHTVDAFDPSLALIETMKESFEKLGPTFNAVQAQRQLLDKDNVFENDKYAAQIFEDTFYARLSKPEQIALTKALGAMLTVIPPLSQPGYTLVLADFEKGTHGLEVAKEEFVHDLSQLNERLNDPKEFNKRVIKKNQKSLRKLQDKARKKNPLTISSLQILDIQRAYDELPNLTAVSSGIPCSPEFRMALRLKMMDLMADSVVLEKDWAVSEDHTYHVVRATQIQMGLVGRGHANAHNLELQNHKLMPMSFADRYHPMMKHIEYCAKHGIQARHHALAVFRLLECYEMLVEPSAGKASIDVNAIHDSLLQDMLSYRTRKDLQAFYARDRRYLMIHCVDWLEEEDLKDLNADIRDAWLEVKGKKEQHFTPSLPATQFGSRLGGKRLHAQ